MYRLSLGFALLALCLVTPARPDLLISSFNNDSVLRYSDSGAFLNVLVAPGAGGLDAPRGVAVGPGNRLYVASQFTDEVLRYDAATGIFIDAFVPAGGVDRPTDLGFEEDGNLYVLSGFIPAEVKRYTPGGADLGDFVNGAMTMPVLNSPLYLAFGSDEFALTTDTGRFFRFSSATGAQLSSTVLDNPRGLAYDPLNNIYVAQSISDNILKRDAGTGIFSEFIPTGTGGLSAPFDVAFGPDGNLYVSTGSNNVLRYNGITGAFLDEFIASGSGGLSGPRYMTFVTPVPEPGTGLLVIGALIALAIRRRR